MSHGFTGHHPLLDAIELPVHERVEMLAGGQTVLRVDAVAVWVVMHTNPTLGKGPQPRKGCRGGYAVISFAPRDPDE